MRSLAATANAIPWNLGNWLARLLPPLYNPALELAIDKLSQAIPVVLTILLLTRLTGDELGAIFMRGGDLAKSLRFGKNRTDSIWGPVLFHAGYDLTAIIPVLVSG